jgi:hypothetical protein
VIVNRTPDLDLDALRCIVKTSDWDGLGRDSDLAMVQIGQIRAILEALERADDVADQGCEFCGAMVDDWGEERDGGREPHASWWACGRCWNASAERTSTIIGHLSDLLDRALERLSTDVSA